MTNTLTLSETFELIATMNNPLPYLPKAEGYFRDNHRNIYVSILSLADKKFVKKLVDMMGNIEENGYIDLFIMSPLFDENSDNLSRHNGHIFYEINIRHEINIYDAMVNCKSYGVIDRTNEDETQYFNAYFYYNQNSMALNKFPKNIAMILSGLINKFVTE